MAAIVVSEFRGQTSKVSNRNLPEPYAAKAVNCSFENGELRPRYGDIFLADWVFDLGVLASTFPNDGLYSAVELQALVAAATPRVDVVRAPVVNDVYSRVYVATPSGPYTIGSEELTDADPFTNPMGVLPPAEPPVLDVNTLGTGAPETRAYVYTFASRYGEESAPSPPLLIPSTTTDATIELTMSLVAALPANTDAPPGIAGAAPPLPAAGVPSGTYLRLYRTVPGASSAAFFFAGEYALPNLTDPVTAIDSLSPDVVALNETLISTDWFPPPTRTDGSGLNYISGLAAMENGIIAGFVLRDICFAEPYRPHAWPRAYIQSTEDDIVNITPISGGLAILTTGAAYVATGTDPAAMLITKVSRYAPCIAAASVVSMAGRAFYASVEGLAEITLSGVRIVTDGVLSKQSWAALVAYPETTDPNIVGVYYEDDTYLLLKPQVTDLSATLQGYPEFADIAESNGIVFKFSELDRGYSLITFDLPFKGAYNAPTYRPRPDIPRVILETDGEASPIEYAAYLYGAGGSGADANGVDYLWRSKKFFMTKPVNFSSYQVDRGDLSFYTGDSLPPPAQPTSTTIRIYADGVELHEEVVTPGVPGRIPSTVKAQVWEFELEGNLPIARVVLAETAKELETV